jgi:hypothetical protein
VCVLEKPSSATVSWLIYPVDPHGVWKLRLARGLHSCLRMKCDRYNHGGSEENRGFAFRYVKYTRHDYSFCQEHNGFAFHNLKYESQVCGYREGLQAFTFHGMKCEAYAKSAVKGTRRLFTHVRR